MLTGLFAIALLIAKLFPTTPSGRWLHLTLVETPVVWLSRVERKHVIFMLILLFAGQALAMAAPLELVLIYAFDVSVYLDVVVAVGTFSAANRAKLAWTTLKAAVMRAVTPRSFVVAQRSRPRTIRARVRKMPANQNDEGRAATFLRAA